MAFSLGYHSPSSQEMLKFLSLSSLAHRACYKTRTHIQQVCQYLLILLNEATTEIIGNNAEENILFLGSRALGRNSYFSDFF